MALLSVRHAAVGFDRQPILNDISFDLPAYSICCLLGANGSGKTTLMRTLLGIIPLLSGEMLLNGEPIHSLSERRRASVVAWVPQAHDGAFAFTVLDMVMMGLASTLSSFAAPGKRQRELAYQQLSAVGIPHLASRPWRMLSGGEQQLVLIARALIQQPLLLLLDEPASSLDFGHQIRLLETLVMLKERGMALLMSTHHPLHAKAIADKVVCIASDGQVSHGDVEQQLAVDKLAALYRISPLQLHRHLFGTQ